MSMRSRPAVPPAPPASGRTASVADFNDSPFVALLKRENKRVAQTSASINPVKMVEFNSCDEMIEYIETEAAKSAEKIYPNAVETGVKTEYDREYYFSFIEMAIDYMKSAPQECKETLEGKMKAANEELNKLGVSSFSYVQYLREKKQVEMVG